MTGKKVVRRALAEADLDGIWDYIAVDSIEQAERFLRHLNTKLKNLAESPYLGRKREELMLGLRSFPVGNYVIFYLPKREGIEVVRVLHGARDIEDIFSGIDERTVQ